MELENQIQEKDVEISHLTKEIIKLKGKIQTLENHIQELRYERKYWYDKCDRLEQRIS